MRYPSPCLLCVVVVISTARGGHDRSWKWWDLKQHNNVLGLRFFRMDWSSAKSSALEYPRLPTFKTFYLSAACFSSQWVYFLLILLWFINNLKTCVCVCLLPCVFRRPGPARWDGCWGGGEVSYLPGRPGWRRARHARQLLPRLLPQMPPHMGRGDTQCCYLKFRVSRNLWKHSWETLFHNWFLKIYFLYINI